MSEIGELLRDLRIKKGLSVDDIQEITKIRSRYIQAIEEGSLDKLPGQFYAKAFIKTYAEVLELDPKVLKEYQESIPNPEIELIPIKTHYHSMANSPSKLGKWLIVSLVYILIALVILFAYMFYVSHSEEGENLPGDPIGDSRLEVPYPPSDQTNPNEKNGTEQPQTGNADVEKPQNEIQIIKIRTTTYRNRPMDEYEVTLGQNANIQMRLKFTSRSWFDIRSGNADGKQILSQTFNPGQETEFFSLEQQIWLHLGYASGVEITIGDKIIKAGTEEGPKYISITRKIKET